MRSSTRHKRTSKIRWQTCPHCHKRTYYDPTGDDPLICANCGYEMYRQANLGLFVIKTEVHEVVVQ